ncbi:MAG: CDP-diacylglycerol-inositol 3-phosphatidyltransferase [Heterodermia speciosa]|uniref:CDP-diacylglycerol-inositol 3-phosphatidyltransferase n=1 Tax=Heterodermia speciosa TaxID=116794 RepID=A0A8H3FSX0_9LECA|nr:MAG: CDP-diacylglycerol-inositol 3-phosphatidyltransferase [Heterodermia speciosa]
MNGVKTRKQTAKEVKGEPSSKGLNGSANGHLSRDLTASSRAKSTENIFLFYPNIIGSSLPVRLPIFNAYLFGSGYSRIILAIASLYYMPLHPRTCSLLYSVSCLLDALDGVAARYFQQATKFGAVLDMVTDRCTTACLLVFLASAFPTWSILFQGLISLDLASHYMHMYATLSMGGSGQSHKKVDQKRTGKLLYLYYNNKNVLFAVCALNELFFIALYLLSFSSPILSPSLLTSDNSPPASAQPGTPMFPAAALLARPGSAWAMELARANKMDSTFPWFIAAISSPVMAFKQYLNVVQLLEASKWLAEGDIETRRQQGLS